MRNRMVMFAVLSLVAGGLLAAIPASADSTGKVQEYVVQYREGVSAAEAGAEIGALGGRVVEEISEIGAAKVRTSNPEFAISPTLTHCEPVKPLEGATLFNRIASSVRWL